MTSPVMNTQDAISHLRYPNPLPSKVDFRIIKESYFRNVIAFTDAGHNEVSDLVEESYNFLCLPRILTVSDTDILQHITDTEPPGIIFL